MRKLSLLLISAFLVVATFSAYAVAAPDIRGEYSGSYSTVVSNCMDSSDNGTYYADLEMNIPTQSGNTFSGTATGTYNIEGYIVEEYIQLTGTITETGQISGNTSHTLLDSGGTGTFTGQLSGNTLSIVNPGQDTYGDTCNYTRTMTATRAAPPLVSVPDVGGLTQSAAEVAIVAVGLSVGDITNQSSNTVPVGSVISQAPSAGTEVTPGSEVDLVISLGVQPLVNFSANPTSGNASLSVNFVDDSTGNITSWNWDFGDGANSTSQYPSHNYSAPGTYSVSLTVSGPAGSDTETKVAYISVLSSTGYTYDATGIWNYTESNLQHNCPETPYTLDSGQIGLLQTEGTFIIRADEFSTQGTVGGATYNYSDKWCDFFDSVEVSFDSNASITLQSLTGGSGSVNFTATWSGGSCTGSHNLSISRPATVAPIYDASGKWNFTLSDFSLNCGSPPLSSGFVDVVQTGNKVSAVDNSGNTYNGFVDGTQYALLRSYMEDGGRMTETILLDLSSANKGIGDAGFVWDSDCEACWGNWQISISKTGSANIAPIISLLLEEDQIGFTYAELSGNTFQLTYIEFPTCGVDEGTFINNEQYIDSDGGINDYTIDNGCIILDPGPDTKLCVKSRTGEEVIAEFTTNGGDFVDRTDQWNTDFSTLNNDAIALKDWFVTNGWWPGSAILADGRVTNQDASFDGKWWIDQNVLYIAHPESDTHPDNAGCVDHKAYKLVNDRLMFATDAAFTQTYSIVKL